MDLTKMRPQISGSVQCPEQWDSVISCISGCKYYAYIFHDSDDGKVKHLHFIAEARHNAKRWSELLGIPVNMLEFPRNFRAVNRYLIHKDSPDKFQYDPKAVITNRPTRFSSYLQDNIELNSVDMFKDLQLLKNKKITCFDFLEKYKYWLDQQSFYTKFKIYSEILRYYE